jgi:hypothetical protein
MRGAGLMAAIPRLQKSPVAVETGGKKEKVPGSSSQLDVPTCSEYTTELCIQNLKRYLTWGSDKIGTINKLRKLPLHEH